MNNYAGLNHWRWSTGKTLRTDRRSHTLTSNNWRAISVSCSLMTFFDERLVTLVRSFKIGPLVQSLVRTRVRRRQTSCGLHELWRTHHDVCLRLSLASLILKRKTLKHHSQVISSNSGSLRIEHFFILRKITQDVRRQTFAHRLFWRVVMIPETNVSSVFLGTRIS